MPAKKESVYFCYWKSKKSDPHHIEIIMSKSTCPYGLGATSKADTFYLLYNHITPENVTLRIEKSNDGFSFQSIGGTPQILSKDQKPIHTQQISDVRISEMKGAFFATYKWVPRSVPHLAIAVSQDMVNWNYAGQVADVSHAGMIVPLYKYQNQYVLYWGEENIHIAYSVNLDSWTVHDTALLTPRPDHFDHGPLLLGSVKLTNKGIQVWYFVHTTVSGVTGWAVGGALFDAKNPTKILWRSDQPILAPVPELVGKSVYPVGIVERGENELISYWDVENEGIVAIAHPYHGQAVKIAPTRLHLTLKKFRENPILKPIAEHLWESKAVFNPAALYDSGKVHLIYRAVGENDVSVLGYATSQDGVAIDERMTDPVYVPTQPFEINVNGGNLYNSPFMSGGAYGGVEDPRITKIDDKIYMTYVAYDGANPPRVALTSISVDNFRKRNWDWKTPVLISPPGVVDKNCAILPEKVNGKYVIFHRIFPHILVDYVDDLEFDGKTKWLKGEHIITPRLGGWDSRKVGVGPTPLKTDEGWLVIYHAVDDRDASRYKMGAMLLDHDDPTRVLYRTTQPILAPEEWYENEGWKYGVAYPCGAAVLEKDLYVYYGGADTVVCAASAPLDDFLGRLKHADQAQLVSVKQRSF